MDATKCRRPPKHEKDWPSRSCSIVVGDKKKNALWPNRRRLRFNPLTCELISGRGTAAAWPAATSERERQHGAELIAHVSTTSHLGLQISSRTSTLFDNQMSSLRVPALLLSQACLSERLELRH